METSLSRQEPNPNHPSLATQVKSLASFSLLTISTEYLELDIWQAEYKFKIFMILNIFVSFGVLNNVKKNVLYGDHFRLSVRLFFYLELENKQLVGISWISV